MALPQAYSFQNTSVLLVGLLVGAYAGVLFTGFFLLNAPPSDLEFLYLFWKTATSSTDNFIALAVPILLFVAVGFLVSYVLILKLSLKGASTTFSSVREADKSKDEFISMVLHHIRTPLAGIKWSLSEMSKRTGISAEDSEAVNRVITENNRALTAVDHLIEASRASTERVAYNFEIVATPVLLKCVTDAVEALRPSANEKKISLTVELSSASEHPFRIDKEKIMTVTQTLVENAIGYSKSGGSVTIRSEETEDVFKLHIADSGIGIPLADQPKIFSQFFRSENAKRADPGGFGVGLFLVKTFVTEHGGTVSFVSEEGKGTVFTVELPIIKASSEQYLQKI